MKFWEAMKALQEGKKVKPAHWDSLEKDNIYSKENFKTRFNIWTSDLHSEWEIVEKREELYWQWRNKKDFKVRETLMSDYDLLHYADSYKGLYEKHAGPWIKTENGFKKHKTWEQF